MKQEESTLLDSEDEGDQAAGTPMDDQTLLGIIGQYESESFGFSSGDLANRRAYRTLR
jgi:hypothetical protein